MRHRVTIVALTAGLVLTSATLRAEPARMAPADTGVFVQFDDLADWRAQWAGDPLIGFLRDQIPGGPEPQAWRQVQEALGMSGDEILDRYFGTRVAILSPHPGDESPRMLLSRVAEAEAQLAIERLGLRREAEVGGFRIYATADDQARLAFGNGWMAMADRGHAPYLRSVLSGPGGASLAEDPQFQAAVAELPDPRSVLVFSRKDEGPELHSGALVRDGRSARLHYRGRSPDIRELLGRVAEADRWELGPLPAATLIGLTLNLRDEEPDPGVNALMDRLLAPGEFRSEVLPHLGAPTVLWLSEIPGDRVSPRTPFPVPALGLMLRLKEPQVAERLDRALQNLVMVANLATLQWEVDPIELRSAEENDWPFQVANVGRALADHWNEPAVAGGLSLSFGGLGDWYLLATHEEAFREAVRALLEDGVWAPGRQVLESARRRQDQHPVAAAAVDAPGLAAHLAAWMAFLGDARPDLVEAAREHDPTGGPAQAIRGLHLLHGILEHLDLVGMHAVAEPDGQVLEVEIHLAR